MMYEDGHSFHSGAPGRLPASTKFRNFVPDGTKFIGKNLGKMYSEKQTICPIRSRPVAVFGTDCNEITVEQVSDQTVKLVGCRATKLMVILARTQASATMRVPVAELHLLELRTNAKQRIVSVGARGVCDMEPNRLFTIFFASWLNVPIVLPNYMLAAQCETSSETIPPEHFECDGITMTQLYK